MNRNMAILLNGFLFGLTFLSCQKKQDDCPPTDNYLLYLFVQKVSNISTPDATDTTGLLANVYKSNAGAQMAVLKTNDKDLPLVDDGITRCASGSQFNTDVGAIAKAELSDYFLLGQSNSLQLSGERCGTINKTYTLPKETRLKPIPSGIIHRNQDLVMEVTGVSDYPIDMINNDNPTSFFDQISVTLAYFRSNSDTLSYPSLPYETVYVGAGFSPSPGNKIVIPTSELQKFPLNGTISISFSRNTQTKLPNGGKGELQITFRQEQFEFFDVKN